MLNTVIILLLSYLVGSIPSGLIFVKIISGKDVRHVESGRTGGTNAMRAAGLGAGILTAALDVLKGVASAWIVAWLAPGNIWLQIFAALMTIIGHNYSIFLIERNEAGKIRLRGGAGGATCLGGAIAIWPTAGLIIFPLSALVFLIIGYASLTTISVAFFASLIFAYRAYLGLSSWTYVIYGIIAEIILLWALRPNIKRLIAGNERMVGFSLQATLAKQHSKPATRTEPRKKVKLKARREEA